MSDRELLEFTDTMVSINIVLEPEAMSDLKRDWGKVKGIQPPLVGTHKNGLSVFIPWILEGQDE